MPDSLMKRTETAASLQAFLIYLTRQQEKLVGKQQKLDQVRHWFSEGTVINKEQRQFIIDVISSTREPGQALCGLIESRSHQAYTNQLRYPLADALYQFSEQTDELLFRLTTLHITRSGLVVQREKLQAIYNKLLAFIFTYDDILQMISMLRSQLYSQEKKPAGETAGVKRTNKHRGQIIDLDQQRVKMETDRMRGRT